MSQSSGFSPSIEAVRHKRIEFEKLEKIWKLQAPKGKVYAGFKFRYKKDRKYIDGWVQFGYAVVPVYKKVSPTPMKKGGAE